MLDFETYYKKCEDLNEQIKKANYKIVYREIEVIGHKKGMSFLVYPLLTACNTTASDNTTTTKDEEAALKNDLDYQRLVYERDELQTELNFIRDHAEYPHKDAEARG